MRSGQHTEIVVLGAGPTGCTAATLLARAGHDVLVVDPDPEPRKVVGESLLPAGNRVLELLGVSMDGFQVKRGAIFTRDGSASRVDFSEANEVRWPTAHQVPRHLFDRRLRACMQEAGARRLVARATGASLPGRLETDAGPVRADWILDAAGRSMFLARHLGDRHTHPVLRNAAVVRYYRDVRPLPPYEEGDIAIAAFRGGWFWFIPFRGGEWSVGLVTTADARLEGDRWEAALDRSADARARLEGASLVGGSRGVQDFTARAGRFHGEGWALLGDAALFLDPVFSSGVLLGLESAARFVDHFRAGTLAAYEAELRAAAALLEKVVLAFYDGTFLDVILAPRERQPDRYRGAIIALLAGNVFDRVHPDALAITERFPQVARFLRNQGGAPAAER
jgi:flavin-dependent dehydrogenase